MNDTRLQAASARTEENESERVARDIARLARERARETERGRRLPEELVTALRRSGLLRAGAPVEVEGLELAPGAALRCAEEVAQGDASAGWCVSIAITSSLLAAYLPTEAREELFGGGRGSLPGCGRRVAGHGRSTAVSWCPGGGRSAAGSCTPICCSPAASSTVPLARAAGAPCRRSWPFPSRIWRFSTPGTRSGCAAPAVTCRRR